MTRFARCLREVVTLAALGGFLWLAILLMAAVAPERLPS